MGLDMYINAVRKTEPMADVISIKLNIDKNTVDSVLKEVVHLMKIEDDEMVYWRKAHNILYWFKMKFGEMENCKKYKITKEILEELLHDCQKRKLDKFNAEPSKDFDLELTNTIQKIHFLLKDFDFEKFDLVFWAWW